MAVERALGLEAIANYLRALYPDQPNPLQMAARVKLWLGGPDPLDYISMYSHQGDPATETPPHWHYVSFGFSDLHGDGRVHEPRGPGASSGFGFELTFRLKREPSDDTPPIWPAELLQTLAKYVFQTGNGLCPGDHISWHNGLDQSEGPICQMLLAADPKLHDLETPLGVLKFIQIIGITNEELKTVQEWNGPGVTNLLRQNPLTGGAFLVTDMKRKSTIFEIDKSAAGKVKEGMEKEGSNLSGVSGLCLWEDPSDNEEEESIINTPTVQQQQQTTLNPSILEAGLQGNVQLELMPSRTLHEVHMKFNLEAGSLLPLCLKGRLLHGRHFTFKNISADVAITLVSDGVEGSYASKEQPFVAKGPWLHVYIGQETVNKIVKEVEPLELSKEQVNLPAVFRWPEHGMMITVIPD